MTGTEITETKKFNKANLPYLITVAIFIIGFAILLIDVYILKGLYALFIIFVFCLWGSIISTYTICPISLVFQILHKNKTLFDKWILGLNLIGTIFSIMIFVFVLFAFPNDFKGEKDIRKQINAEYSILNKEYKPVLNYLAEYKKNNGVYPPQIDEKILPKSKTFEMHKYSVVHNGEGYWLSVYPIKGPIEYYYNDENDNGYNFYNGNGYIDGCLDNDYYYEIDEKWHAVMLQHFTRHSIIGKYGNTEREVDEYMKDNFQKMEQN